ncbi:hypothetical protein F511_03837 [Dorcoceras hygrometricum]|uniref:Uncharacterized protein n=1 Tax=Dorcoceras hygrometricum TaxID=472368 RepID=A0A2Z7BQ27_9LAMI|nr:hypothetical protein F511_03837 [Dorcoceras hygrometricum]
MRVKATVTFQMTVEENLVEHLIKVEQNSFTFKKETIPIEYLDLRPRTEHCTTSPTNGIKIGESSEDLFRDRASPEASLPVREHFPRTMSRCKEESTQDTSFLTHQGEASSAYQCPTPDDIARGPDVVVALG